MGIEPNAELHKLLNILASLPLSASNCVQLQEFETSRHCLFGESASQMNVVEGRASVGVTELLEALTSLGRIGDVQELANDGAFRHHTVLNPNIQASNVP